MVLRWPRPRRTIHTSAKPVACFFHNTPQNHQTGAFEGLLLHKTKHPNLGVGRLSKRYQKPNQAQPQKTTQKPTKNILRLLMISLRPVSGLGRCHVAPAAARGLQNDTGHRPVTSSESPENPKLCFFLPLQEEKEEKKNKHRFLKQKESKNECKRLFCSSVPHLKIKLVSSFS